jgi:hypothetical protein
MSKRIERKDVSVFLLRNAGGLYLVSSKPRRFKAGQRRAFRFKSRDAARAAKTNDETLVRLVVRVSEEEG